MQTGRTRVEVRGVSKSFGGTRALRAVDLVALGGSVHAVTGENGAGKSTLMKLLAGVYTPDEGHLLLDGDPLRLAGPADARRAGISTVFQELTVLPSLTVAQNIYLGQEPLRGGLLDRTAMREGAREVLARVGLALEPGLPCAALSLGERQMVEIAKGLVHDARVFIFDEPTAALNRAEVAQLGRLLAQLRAAGKLVFYISHRLEEIFGFCDVVTVLKDGAMVDTRATSELDADGLITMMVGRPLQALFPPRALVRREPAFQVEGLVAQAGMPAVSLTIGRGEIVGIAGLEGQGQREIVRAIAGLLRPVQGVVARVAHGGRRHALAPRRGASAMVRQGVALLPEDRKAEGLYLDLAVHDNIWLGALRRRGLFRRAPRDGGAVARLAARLRLRESSLREPAGSLSGGNQQKAMLGRWLVAGVDVLLVEQPTRGVDVGAKAEIYQLLREFCDEGGAVLAVSAELPELIGLADRLLVVRGGAIVAELNAANATEESVLQRALVAPVAMVA